MKKAFFFTSLFLISANLQLNAQSMFTPRLGVDPIEKVIAAMTLEEKLNLLIGSTGKVSTNANATIGNSSELVPGAAGQSNGIDRLGIPATVLADGPAGLRINPTRKGTSQTFYCTHFPIATVMSSTWNQALVHSVGKAMGSEVLHYGADVLLAPATNIQRNPLNGRNFEYYSEDPLLSGKICAAMVNGVESNGVGTSLKHFAFNNQETNRTSNNVVSSPRALREIYLKPFEITIKEAQPWTVMTSYNKVNGTMTSERADLVTEILRHEWGFKGLVITDWYGGQSATAQMMAGNDLLMPGKAAQYEELHRAVTNGNLSMELIDRNMKHMLEYIIKTPRFKGYQADNYPDLKTNAEITRNAALEGIVLLKNEKEALPLAKKTKKVAVFGRTSYDFIAGGTGSGNVNHAYVVNLLQGLTDAGLQVDETIQAAYEKYIPAAKAAQPKSDNPFAYYLPINLIEEMNLTEVDLATAAQTNDVAIVTIGKSSGEFADRSIKDNYQLTAAEQAMMKAVSTAFHKAGKRVIVILNICGPIETKSWADLADAIVNAWLPGQEGGHSVADILMGKESPSGRLPMTWPASYNDVPSKADFPNPDAYSEEDLLEQLTGFADVRTTGSRKNFDYTEYNDGIYVGYRYYTTKNISVSYPFGYGLSYSKFKYSEPNVCKAVNGDLTVEVKVRNTGRMAAKEVVQVYVAAPGKDMEKPARELKGFAKTRKIAPGESQTVTINIPYESLASFNEKDSQWQVETGIYQVMVARHAADSHPLTVTIEEAGRTTEKVRPSLSLEAK